MAVNPGLNTVQEKEWDKTHEELALYNIRNIRILLSSAKTMILGC